MANEELFNAWGQLRAAVKDGLLPRSQAVQISYDPADTHSYACWAVISPFFKTDPGAHWLHHGSKTFTVRGRDEKAPALEEAQRWAAEHYGVTEWERNRAGDYVPAGVNKNYPLAKRER